jgi:hypothetical protein
MRIHARSHWIAGAIALAALLDATWGWVPRAERSVARPDASPAGPRAPVVEPASVAATPATARPTPEHANATAARRDPRPSPARPDLAPTRLRAATARHALIATLDPETGRLSTDVAPPGAGGDGGDPRLEAAARSRPVLHPDGSISMSVRDWMRENFLVRLGPDGQPVPLCVDGHEATRRALATPARPALEEE